MTTITIRADYLEAAREKLGKLAKKAAGYGQVVTFTFGEPRGEKRSTVNAWGERIEYTEWYVDVDVTGDAPRIGNHTLLARLTREAGGVIVDRVPGTDDSVGELGRAWAGTCDHCGHDRQRNHGFVVEENGVQKIVGRTCLRDYLGVDTPEKALWVFTFVRELDKSGGDDDWGMLGGGRDWYTITRELLAATSAAIDLWGWRPVSAGDRSDATIARVETLWADTRYWDARDIRHIWKRDLQAALRDNTEKHYKRADEVIAWGETIVPGKSDYLHNLKLLLAQADVTMKRQSYVASAVAAFERDQGRKLEAERRAKAEVKLNSNHVGAVGERITVEAVVEHIRALPADQWGDMSVYTFRAANGDKLSWLTASYGANVEGIGREDRVKLVGTVKSHAEYKGVKETRLSRCKIEKIVVAEAA